jgi:uncharacterized membrane protein
MAKKTNADYKREQLARKKQRQAEQGERDVVVPMSAGIWSMLQDLCKWHAFTDWRELVFTMIRVCHAAGPGSNALVQIPKVGFVPTEAQLQACGEPCNKCDGDGMVYNTETQEFDDCLVCCE